MFAQTHSFQSIDLCEDRDRFNKLIKELKIHQPKSDIVYSFSEAKKSIKLKGLTAGMSYHLAGCCSPIKGDTIAPIEPANPNIIPISDPEKPSPPSATVAERYRAVNGSQAPQIANWRNIMVPKRVFLFIC